MALKTKQCFGFLWALIFVCSSVLPVHAEEVDEQKAIEQAARNNPGLRAAILEWKSAQQMVTAAAAEYTTVLQFETGATHNEQPRATQQGVTESSNDAIDLGVGAHQRLPWGTDLTLDVTGNGQIQRVNPQPTTSNIIKLGPTYGIEARLGVTQPILRGAGLDVGEAELRTSQLKRNTAQHKRDRTASELLRDLLIGYWKLWYSERALEVQHRDRDFAHKQYQEAEQKAQLGTIAPSDTLNFATQLAQLEEAVAQAEVDRKSHAVELGRLLGLDPLRSMDMELTSPTPQAFPNISSEKVLEIAQKNALSLREQEAQVELAREKLEVSRDSLQSRLDLNAYLLAQGLGYRDSLAPLEQVGTLSAISGHVGIEFELPVSNAQRRAELSEARFALEAATYTFAEQRDHIKVETATWLEKLRSAEKRLTLAQKTVDVAVKLAEAERERLALGTTTALQVLKAQEDLRDAELRLLQVDVDRATACITLLHLTAALLPKYTTLTKGL